MKKLVLVFLWAVLMFPHWVVASSEGELAPGMINPGHEQVPDWFKVSFLDL